MADVGVSNARKIVEHCNFVQEYRSLLVFAYFKQSLPPLCQLNHISFEFAVYAGVHSCRQSNTSGHGKMASVYLHSPGGHTFASNIVKVVLLELQTCVFHQFWLPVQLLLSLLSPLMTQSDFNWVREQSQTVVGKHKHVCSVEITPVVVCECLATADVGEHVITEVLL